MLILLGSASHTITQERRQVAWSPVNPNMGTLPEDTEEAKDKLKETTLFGGSFLERATKRLEEPKAQAKVAGARNSPSPKCKQNRDPNDLCSFLEKGAPVRYGGRNPKCLQLYPQQRPPKFQRRDQGRSKFPPKKNN